MTPRAGAVGSAEPWENKVLQGKTGAQAKWFRVKQVLRVVQGKTGLQHQGAQPDTSKASTASLCSHKVLARGKEKK